MSELPKRPKEKDFKDDGGYYEVAQCVRDFDEATEAYEHAVAKALWEALDSIMKAVKTPPFTNMSRADMREIAGETLERVKASGWTP